MNNDIIEAKISEIQLGNRHRKDMGDMEASPSPSRKKACSSPSA